MLSHSTRESMLAVKTRTRTMRAYLTMFFGLTVAMATSGVSGAPVVLLSDDFEGYPAGTGIAGQGGWYAFRPEQAPIIVATGSGTPPPFTRGDQGG